MKKLLIVFLLLIPCLSFAAEGDISKPVTKKDPGTQSGKADKPIYGLKYERNKSGEWVLKDYTLITSEPVFNEFDSNRYNKLFFPVLFAFIIAVYLIIRKMPIRLRLNLTFLISIFAFNILYICFEYYCYEIYYIGVGKQILTISSLLFLIASVYSIILLFFILLAYHKLTKKGELTNLMYELITLLEKAKKVVRI